MPRFCSSLRCACTTLGLEGDTPRKWRRSRLVRPSATSSLADTLSGRGSSDQTVRTSAPAALSTATRAAVAYSRQSYLLCRPTCTPRVTRLVRLALGGAAGAGRGGGGFGGNTWYLKCSSRGLSVAGSSVVVGEKLGCSWWGMVESTWACQKGARGDTWVTLRKTVQGNMPLGLHGW